MGHGHVDTLVQMLVQMLCRAFSPGCSLYLCTHTHTHTHTHTQLWNWMKSSIFPDRIDGIEYRCCPHCGAAIVKNGGYFCVRPDCGSDCACRAFCVFACMCTTAHIRVMCTVTYMVRVPLCTSRPQVSRAQTSTSARANKLERARARAHTRMHTHTYHDTHTQV